MPPRKKRWSESEVEIAAATVTSAAPARFRRRRRSCAPRIENAIAQNAIAKNGPTTFRVGEEVQR